MVSHQWKRKCILIRLVIYLPKNIKTNKNNFLREIPYVFFSLFLLIVYKCFTLLIHHRSGFITFNIRSIIDLISRLPNNIINDSYKTIKKISSLFICNFLATFLFYLNISIHFYFVLLFPPQCNFLSRTKNFLNVFST